MSGDPVTRERRRPGGRDDPRAPAPHSAARRLGARAGLAAQGGAPPAHGLVQGARRHQPARRARAPTSGPAASPERPPAIMRSRSRGEPPQRGSTASSSAGARRARSSSTAPGRSAPAIDVEAEDPSGAFARLEEHLGGDRRDPRPPLRRPARDGGTGHGRARDPRGRSRGRRGRRRPSAEAVSSAGSPRRSRLAASASSVSSRRARARSCGRSRRARRSPSRPRRSRAASTHRIAGALSLAICQAAGVEPS